MPLNLSAQQEQKLRNTFQLSYHLDYLDICTQRIKLTGLDVLEIGGALPASLVIDHLCCNSWTSVEAPSYDAELGPANQFHRNSAEKHRLLDLNFRYRNYYCDVEDLGLEHSNQYDLVFSIACFEHINRLPLALATILRCLKPGGRVFTMHSPIWSAYDGHHLPILISDRFDTTLTHQSYIFQPWGHLLQSRIQTYSDIADRFDRQFAEEVIYHTYNSSHINRYFIEDYYMFASSGFVILDYLVTFHRNPSPEIQATLETRYPGYKQFGNNGVFAILQRPHAPILIF